MYHVYNRVTNKPTTWYGWLWYNPYDLSESDKVRRSREDSFHVTPKPKLNEVYPEFDPVTLICIITFGLFVLIALFRIL